MRCHLYYFISIKVNQNKHIKNVSLSRLLFFRQYVRLHKRMDMDCKDTLARLHAEWMLFVVWGNVHKLACNKDVTFFCYRSVLSRNNLQGTLPASLGLMDKLDSL